jgi:hypothetical protein
MLLAKLGLAAGGVAYPAASTSIKPFQERLLVDREFQIKLKAVRKQDMSLAVNCRRSEYRPPCRRKSLLK